LTGYKLNRLSEIKKPKIFLNYIHLVIALGDFENY